jgi:hypothetical protein
MSLKGVAVTGVCPSNRNVLFVCQLCLFVYLIGFGARELQQEACQNNAMANRTPRDAMKTILTLVYTDEVSWTTMKPGAYDGLQRKTMGTVYNGY